MWSSVAGSGQSQCLLQHKITYCVSVTGTGLTSSSVLIIPSPVMTSCLSCLPATGQVWRLTGLRPPGSWVWQNILTSYILLTVYESTLSLTWARCQAAPALSHIPMSKWHYVTTHVTLTIQMRLQIINHSQDWSSLLFILSLSRIICLSLISKGVRPNIIMMMMIQMKLCVLICSFLLQIAFPSHFKCQMETEKPFQTKSKSFI